MQIKNLKNNLKVSTVFRPRVRSCSVFPSLSVTSLPDPKQTLCLRNLADHFMIRREI